MKELRRRLRRGLAVWRLALRHPRAALVLIITAVIFCAAVYYFASVSADAALAEERAFWAQARGLTLEQRTLWDSTARFKDGRLVSHEQTVAEFRRFIEGLDLKGVYLLGFRWRGTPRAAEIERDGQDINSHILVMTEGKFFHMFRYGNAEDPIVADFQERFFAYNKEMQPVWVAQVLNGNRRPFRFTASTQIASLRQRIWPYKKLRWLLIIPDWSRGVNAVERTLLYWFRDGYDMYPRLP